MTQYQNTDQAVFELSQAEIDRAIARGRRMRSEAAGDVFAALGQVSAGLFPGSPKPAHMSCRVGLSHASQAGASATKPRHWVGLSLCSEEC